MKFLCRLWVNVSFLCITTKSYCVYDALMDHVETCILTEINQGTWILQPTSWNKHICKNTFSTNTKFDIPTIILHWMCKPGHSFFFWDTVCPFQYYFKAQLFSTPGLIVGQYYHTSFLNHVWHLKLIFWWCRHNY